jgi:hypothetical protein
MKTSTALKSTTTKTPAPANDAFVVPTLKSNAKNASVIALIEKALKGARSMVQSIEQLEPHIAAAELACLTHAEAHGDAMPADRLVKGLIACNHPATTALSQEVVGWFRTFSPVRWDMKGKVSVLKEGQEGYKPFEAEKAEATPFNETPAAKRARAASARAHKAAMKDADLKMMISRAQGVIAWFNNIVEGKDRRKVKTGEEAKMKKFAKALNTLTIDFVGKPEAAK